MSINTVGDSKNDNQKKRHSIGLVAMAAAAISSTVFISNENQTKLKEKLVDQQKKLNKKFEKSLFLQQINPVKITVQSDAGSIASYSSSKNPNSIINKEESSIASNTRIDASFNNEFSKQINNASNTSKSIERINSSVSSNSTEQTKRNSSRSTRMSNTALSSPHSFKTTNEVLILIETWIKNAPNDFMGIKLYYLFLCFFFLNSNFCLFHQITKYLMKSEGF